MRTIVALTVACLFAGLSIAGESDASIKKYDLNIPRQSLDAALKDFAQQTGLQIARMGNAGKGTEMVGPVSGSLTPQQALDDLLSTQGLSYKVVNETTIAIVKPGAETADNQGGDGTTLNELSPGASTADMRLAQSNAAEESKNANSAAANSAQSSAEDSESKGIQEIVVTAQKREEKMSDVPLSISTVLGEDLVKRNITDTLSLSYNVPSLGAYQVGPGQNLLSLRGISNSRGGPRSSDSTSMRFPLPAA